MKKIFFTLLLLIISVSAYAELNKVTTVINGNIPQSSEWNAEWANIYNNPDDYLEGIDINNATITTTTCTTFSGNITATSITTTGSLNCTNIDSSTIDSVSYDNVVSAFKYTVIDATDSPYTISNGDRLLVDTTSGGVEVLCPASPSVGWVFSYTDATGYFSTNGLTINPNGKLFRGNGASFVTSGTTTQSPGDDTPVTVIYSRECVYGSVSSGWVYYNHGYDD